MATTTVSYNGSKLEPVSTLAIEKVYNLSDDGQRIGTEFIITVFMVLTYFQGSPRSKLDLTLSATGWGGIDNAFWISSGYAPEETLVEAKWFASLYKKQEYIRRLFADKGKSFEWQSASGDDPVKCNPHHIELNFQEGIHNTRTNVVITLRANKLLSATGAALDEDNFNDIFIETANENWTVETDTTPQNEIQTRTYRLSHTVTAKGKEEYDASTGTLTMPAWKQARKFVHNRLGLDNSFLISSGVPDLPINSQGYNHTNSEVVDEVGGTYSVTENWILATNHCLEDFNVRSNFSIEDGLHVVNVEGTITGLELRNSPLRTPPDVQAFMNVQSGITVPTYSGWFIPASGEYHTLGAYVASPGYNAVSGIFTPSGNWELYNLFVEASGATAYINANVSGCLMNAVANMHTRAQNYSGWPLNPIPLSYTVGKNPTAGIVNYSYIYNDRPTNLIPNALSEKISIVNNHPSDIIAIIPIIGRATSLLQSMNTKTERHKLLSIEAVLPRQTSQTAPIMPNVTPIITLATPSSGTFLFRVKDTESMSNGNHYSREIEWIFEP